MLRMNDDFTVVMHVISKDKTSASHLRADLLLGEGATKDLSGLHVTAREIKPSSHPGSMREARVRCTGYDRPGIVYQAVWKPTSVSGADAMMHERPVKF